MINTAYVAGSVKDITNVRTAQNALRELGWHILFDWTGEEGEIRTNWSDARGRGARIAQKEIDACLTANLFLLISPPNNAGLGCWVELGVALAGGAKVIVVSPIRDSVFFCHYRVTLVQSLDEALLTLEVSQ